MSQETTIRFREPVVADAIAITRLIQRCPPLDVNSHYLSLLLCRDFHQTCVIGECGSAIACFLSAYRPPVQDDTIFVWQVAVDFDYRGRGLGSRMLDALLSRTACSGVRYLDATVTPSNTASQKLFQALAKRLNTDCQVSTGFSAEVFDGPEDHEPEDLYRVGPFTLDQGKGH